jgi:hypothetical protein
MTDSAMPLDACGLELAGSNPVRATAASLGRDQVEPTVPTPIRALSHRSVAELGSRDEPVQNV